MTPPTVVGLGEILWDLLPSGRQLGGAPANFAYCSHLLGNRGVVASRVGNDQLGEEIRNSLAKAAIPDEFIQTDPLHSTGTAQVRLDAAGQPQFEITKSVAWDFLEWTDDWQALAKSADAVCFGSLAQRSSQSRNTVLKFLETMPPESFRVFDINLRQNFYSAEIVIESLRRSTAVKLNHEEVASVKNLLSIEAVSDLAFCETLIDRFELKLVCVTWGALGSMLFDGSSLNEHPGFRVQVKDTVGAGDAFTAALVNGFLQGQSLQQMNESANRMGAWVSSNSGAMPQMPAQGIEQALASLG